MVKLGVKTRKGGENISFLIQGAGSSLVSSLGHTQQTPSGSQSASSSLTGPFSNLNLTAQEQTDIQSILQTAQSGTLSFAQLASKIDGVLTPAQQQTFQSDLQTAQATGQHHHHHYHGSGARSTTAIDSGTDAFGVSSTDDSSSTDAAASSLFSDLAAQIGIQTQLQAQTQSLNL
jgi:hypothetical protein